MESSGRINGFRDADVERPCCASDQGLAWGINACNPSIQMQSDDIEGRQIECPTASCRRRVRAGMSSEVSVA
jgi:hypothetical protein